MLMKHQNPYIAGNPVYGQKKFIGRSEVLEEIAGTLRNPDTNAIVLFGQRRIGKSSVLLHLKQQLIERSKYTPIYFDLQYNATCPLVDVLYRIAQKIALIVKIPLPARKNFDVDGIFFREAFIPTVIRMIKNQGLILLFDECGVFDVPQQQRIGMPLFAYLQHWLKTGKRIQAVFALGRHPGQLSPRTLLTFKAIRSHRMMMMTQKESETVIRQSEHCTCLKWSHAAIKRIWYWTQGHPYFTQLLCSEIWETGCTGRTGERVCRILRRRTPADVDAAIAGTLLQGAHAFQWFWNDLPLAEQMVMAAMAETHKDYISQEEFTHVLEDSDLQTFLQEVKFTPTMLIWWGLLRPAEEGYRIAIPLLRRWITIERPIRRIKATLEANLERLADALHLKGKRQYMQANLGQMLWQLHTRPGHHHARRI